jgi:hypothetical protein
MDKELKIAVTIFLTFIVFGFASFINLGSFVTPFFINQFVFVLVAVLFYLMNSKAAHWPWLLGYVFICLLSLAIDEFSMGYLAQKYENNAFIHFSRSMVFSITFLILHFGFYIALSSFLFKFTKLKWLLSVQITLILFTVLSLFLNDLPFLGSIVFSIYLISFIVAVNRLLPTENKVFSVLTYQFLLYLVLEGLEYLQ